MTLILNTYLCITLIPFSGPVGQPNNQRLSCCLLGGECQEFVTDQATCWSLSGIELLRFPFKLRPGYWDAYVVALRKLLANRIAGLGLRVLPRTDAYRCITWTLWSRASFLLNWGDIFLLGIRVWSVRKLDCLHLGLNWFCVDSQTIFDPSAIQGCVGAGSEPEGEDESGQICPEAAAGRVQHHVRRLWRRSLAR